ncbi:uncharacterized protein LOC123915799 [Trifolium pratense]|uniref:Uncharacterized protein n=1 Tax=Trifolium pratense TaxID=57577 RepID=A0ACB0JAX8_TRIPR|nr:uncharacterized protein LOC123915799 [Trifolium pratense]CAJ2642141.1 unnamed protein product [Trifolium pratense]
MIEVETMQQPQHHHRDDEGEASFSYSHNHVSPSPSFSSYSSETLAEIAARVIDELRWEPHSEEDALYQPWETNNNNSTNQNGNDEDEKSEFEFAVVSTDTTTFSAVSSADDIFYNGQIKPLYYPIFDQNLLLNDNDDVVSSISAVPNETTTRRRLPLRTLMFEESETTCSSSTDESVDLEGIAEGSYCVWNPNSVGIERKKSNSTGSGSKRWKLRNLLLRSHSDGKDKQPVMFQIPKTTASKVSPTVENHGGKNQSKRKSFLPYRPELVGLFSNVNGLGRNLNPF